MSSQRNSGDRRADIQDYINDVEEKIGCQVVNGLLTVQDAESIQDKLQDSMGQLSTNEDKADSLAHDAFYELVGKLNANPSRRKWLYLYGIHIWIVLVGVALALLYILVKGITNYSIFQDIPMDVIAWGGIGGCAYSIYYLRQNVYEYRLSRYYAVYWMVYPLAGMIFGLGIVLVASSGLLSLQAKPSYAVYASVAFLAGMFQQWVLGTLKDIAEAIHPTM